MCVSAISRRYSIFHLAYVCMCVRVSVCESYCISFIVTRDGVVCCIFFFKAEFLYAAFLTELIVTPQARQQLAACDVASLACQLRFIVSFSPYCACSFF